MVAEFQPTPLLERDGELRLLFDAWQEARAGCGSLWFIVGEAGVGKTGLVEEVLTAAGVAAFWGAAALVSPPDPYLALREAIPGFTPALTQA